MTGSSLDRLRNRAAAAAPAVGEREIEIPLSKIKFDPNQPRKAFHHLDGRVEEKDAAYIAELAESIEANRLIQAITVQEQPDGSYVVVVGECRTRAHLLKGWPTIRAIVRNDLNNRAERLLYRLAENVNRKDLSDDEMAASVRELMDGSEGVPPMSQVAIAAKLGKSEGWVSRFVKFGDEELQRVWVKSGVADTVEKVYRLSILPKAVQVDILRRVELPEDDPEYLEKPLNRSAIDALARDAKIGKADARAQEAVSNDAKLRPVVLPKERESRGNGVGADDSIGQMLAAAAAAGREPALTGKKELSPIVATGYQLPAEARAALLGSLPQIDESFGKPSDGPVVPPVNCRLTTNNVAALLELLKSNKASKETLAMFKGVRCEVNIPGSLAKLIANELMGMIVDDKEVPVYLQTELSKLN